MHENKLLCVKLKNYGSVIKGDYWCLPGGSVENGESLIIAMGREMVEETAVAPDIGNILYLNHFKINDKEHIEFFFHIKNAEDYIHVDLSKASHAEEEIAEIDFIAPSENHLLPDFLKREDIAGQIIDPQGTKYFSNLPV